MNTLEELTFKKARNSDEEILRIVVNLNNGP